jgi:murein DD-endopeptidase MepM/ murein hydrolase activator NlpD
MDLTRSSFTDRLIELNALGFKRWVFENGMPFLSETKWWGEGGDRVRLHNGLDLHLYEDNNGMLRTLGEGTRVPIIYEGRIVNAVKDFLGYSLFAAHDIYDKDRRLFTVYGHVMQRKDIPVGTLLKEGEEIATIAGESFGKVPCHLHLSLAMIPPGISAETLNWRVLDENRDVLFLDPHRIII